MTNCHRPFHGLYYGLSTVTTDLVQAVRLNVEIVTAVGMKAKATRRIAVSRKQIVNKAGAIP